MGAVLVTWGHTCQLPKSLRPWTVQAGATPCGSSSHRSALYQCVCETPESSPDLQEVLLSLDCQASLVHSPTASCIIWRNALLNLDFV